MTVSCFGLKLQAVLVQIKQALFWFFLFVLVVLGLHACKTLKRKKTWSTTRDLMEI